MDLNDTPEEAAWRDECCRWLQENAPRLPEAPSDPVARAKAWQAIRFEGGFAKIGWGPEHGGRNGTPAQQIIFNQEESAFAVPGDFFRIGLNFIAPTLRAHGTDAQKARHLVKLLRGDEVWCQMFSEPGAGSDLASIATMAVRDGDEWVLNGQKVWTSLAHIADFAEVLCRTDPDLPKHQGITAFILDMRTPGVTVRPLRQMTGDADFNEVFLDDVRVPASSIIGEVNQGWQVAVTTLMNERTWSAGGGGLIPLADDLILLARRYGRTDAATRQRLADIWMRAQLIRYLGMRVLTAATQGRRPGPEGSVTKLAYSKLGVDLGEVALDILGAHATAGNSDSEWIHRFLLAAGHRVGGGTDEVNRNIIADRVLRLPGEPRLDDRTPWRELLRSAT